MENPSGTNEQTSNGIEHLSEQWTTFVPLGRQSFVKTEHRINTFGAVMPEMNGPTHDHSQAREQQENNF